MAHLWVRDSGKWQAAKLGPGAAALLALAGVGAAGTKANDTAGAEVVRTASAHSPRWALLAAPDAHVRVNGRTPLAGICVLSDRDEILTRDGTQFFFATESLPVVEEFPAQDRKVFCGRCRREIEATTPAVQCPGAGCNIWYHQTPEFPCFTYHEKCAFCPQSTSLEGGFRWAPEE